MRAIAFTVMGFVYILSISAYIVDEVILSETDFAPRNLNNQRLDSDTLLGDDADAFRELGNRTLNAQDGSDTIIDRIGKTLESSYASIWVVLELISGNYAFNVLHEFGVHPAVVAGIKLIMPLLIASQVIWYLAGRY